MQYLLLLDADFIPSPNLEQSFQSTLRGFKPSLPETKVAYVVPAFEYSEDAKVCVTHVYEYTYDTHTVCL